MRAAVIVLGMLPGLTQAAGLRLSDGFRVAPPLPPGAEEPLLPAGPQSREAEALYRAASEAVLRGDRSAAELACRRTLDLAPAHCDARSALAGMLMDSGRAEEAEAVLEDGLRIAPHHPGLKLLKGRMLVQQGGAEAALRLLVRGAPSLSRDADYHALLAAIYARLGRHQAASLSYQALLQAHPPQPSWWVGLAIAQERRDRPDDALAAYRRALGTPQLPAVLREFVIGRIDRLSAAGSRG